MPLFTTEANARAFKGFPSVDELDLVDLEPNTLVRDVPAFTFMLPGLKQEFAKVKVSKDAVFVIVVDPTHPGTLRTSPFRTSFTTLLAAPDSEPMSIPRSALAVDRVFVWRRSPPQA